MMKTVAAWQLMTLLSASGSAAIAEDAVIADPNRLEQAEQDACAQYGPGYVKLANSDTCIRIGGKIRFDFKTNSDDQQNKQ